MRSKNYIDCKIITVCKDNVRYDRLLSEIEFEMNKPVAIEVEVTKDEKVKFVYEAKIDYEKYRAQCKELLREHHPLTEFSVSISIRIGNSYNDFRRTFNNAGDAALFLYYMYDFSSYHYDEEDIEIEFSGFHRFDMNNIFTKETEDFKNFIQICNQGMNYCECLEDECEICSKE